MVVEVQRINSNCIIVLTCLLNGRINTWMGCLRFTQVGNPHPLQSRSLWQPFDKLLKIFARGQRGETICILKKQQQQHCSVVIHIAANIWVRNKNSNRYLLLRLDRDDDVDLGREAQDSGTTVPVLHGESNLLRFSILKVCFMSC